MKILVSSVLTAPFFLASPVWAFPPSGVSSGPVVQAGYHDHVLQKRLAVRAVRDEGLKLQAEDGGKLTEAHRAYLQFKLDAVLHGNY
jgi:hypothetical protein